jgi:hypothetical protein
MDKAIVCDIDDTIMVPAEKYRPIQNVIDFLKENAGTYKIIMLTARYHDELYDTTIKQLANLGIKYDELIMEPGKHKNHYEDRSMEHALYKANEVRKLMAKYEISLFIDNSKNARHEVKKLNIETKKPENIKPKTLTKNLWSGIFIS